ncbi:MAG: hypothetical protein A2542_03710 [Parcubacteria group bacterium RIFOXYD2_FULL_52_8]|nr:MAG: hypothetical protein A2542_03710 [Parcubacteria group bacterium RIFOXYD2_FULL_52_8]
MSGSKKLQDVPTKTEPEDELEKAIHGAGFLLELGRSVISGIQQAGGNTDTAKVLLRTNPRDPVGIRVRNLMGAVVLAHQLLDFHLGTYMIDYDHHVSYPHVLSSKPISSITNADRDSVKELVGVGLNIKCRTTYRIIRVRDAVAVDDLKCLLNLFYLPSAPPYETVHFLRYCMSSKGNSPLSLNAPVASLGYSFREQDEGLLYSHAQFQVVRAESRLPEGTIVLAEQHDFSGLFRVFEFAKP